jgi:hypothetical protein
MPLDNVIFPDRFRMANRNPHELSPEEQRKSIANFQIAIFEAGRRAYNKVNPRVIQAGSILMRSVESEFGKTGEQARTIPPGASKKLNVRWSGLIEGTAVGRGALYTSLDCKGLLNEAVRYKRKRIPRKVDWKGGEATYTVFGASTKDYGELLVGRVYYSFKLTQDIQVVDLTPSACNGFYDAVENDPGYKAARKDLRVQQHLWQMAFDPVDYTGSRPLGLSMIACHPVHGIQVQTAQTEVPELPGQGLNVVLGGDDDKQLHYLKPIGKLIAGTSGGHSALLEVSLDGKQGEHEIVVPGSVLSIVDQK